MGDGAGSGRRRTVVGARRVVTVVTGLGRVVGEVVGDRAACTDGLTASLGGAGWIMAGRRAARELEAQLGEMVTTVRIANPPVKARAAAFDDCVLLGLFIWRTLDAPTGMRR
jgi:hypothetical protein